MTPILYIGNKNYSSWSMRPWLALKWAKIAFDEVLIPLGGEGYGTGQMANVRAVSPSGRVPALSWGGFTIWESLGIVEWAREKSPDLLPADPEARAVCRSLVAEMHAGLAAMRRDLPMNIRRRTAPRDWPADTRADLKRVEEIWASTRERYGAAGSMLFGSRSIADAFYAPVATRFRTYGVTLSRVAAAYCEAIFADDAFKEWEGAAQAESWTMPSTEAM
jgi:glutathione S-transferase